MSAQEDRSGAFFGRRKGKKLRAGQDRLVHALLPRLRLNPGQDPRTAFGAEIGTYWLEIGFGGGEHLAAQARAHPHAGIVGCEPFVNGMAKLLATVEHESLKNVRLWDDDVSDLLPGFPDAVFERVYILYPDPWPKRRQRKRRLVSDEMLQSLARVLRPGGELRFATDIDDYAGWTLARILRSAHFVWTAERAGDWREPFPGWPGTRYEAKALKEGRKPSYLTFRRV